MSEKRDGDIFMVRARRCKRCGGLLTSRQAVEDGYDHVCKMKELNEKLSKQPLRGQIGLFEEDNQDGEVNE